MRYIFSRIQNSDLNLCVDTLTGVSIMWENKKFNETQEVSIARKCGDISPSILANILRLMGDWLLENHRETL